MLLQKIKSLLINIVLVVFSLGVALGIMELVLPYLKVFSIEEAVYQVKRPVVQYLYGAFHPELHYTLDKNLQNVRLYYPGKLDYTVETNSAGFRGGEWDLSPGRRNIVVLGDSFAFGWGVQFEESVGKRLEGALQKIDPRFQVINLAQSGYSVKEIVRSFEIFKAMLKPEAVVYIFCPNDTESMTSEDAQGDYTIEYQPPPGEAEAFATMRERNQPGYWTWEKFRKGSYLHAFYARFVRPVISKRIRASLHIDSPPQGYDFPPPMTERPTPPDLPEARFLTYCLKRLAQQVDGTLYLLPTSDKSILYRKDDERNLRWVLANFSKMNHKAHFLDFESSVRLIPDGKKYYFLFDDHWSAAGHEFAAQMLFGEMRKELAGRQEESQRQEL
ncbi:SGNH/GDSL hydrolase family protein [Thiovibrio frasassiensis]|uniref:SGNH/GDSL hydrolase family protein n=1 Tax=Thiovibrio frasassiensis TaxID=2984131 RepID=A0A9X4MH71_9BACT|nr:SGNH/GDSL hydrolase family protein [Thiovibrio frasassiensis]MDG4476291.1 SGNH/GDSL hydrolase family protein [Thiovibrio frasassiensis]